MPQYTDIFYHNPFVETVQPVDTMQVADTIQATDAVACDNVVPSFITSGFNGSISPLPRMSYEILEGWNLALLGVLLLLIVLNKQLYPRQFRQVLSIPGGVAHTNQLLREWNPMRSFLCVSFTLGYILLMALFVQKSCVVLSHDVMKYNGLQMFGILGAATAAWVLLRHFTLRFVNWLFDSHDTFDRQMTVQYSVSIFSLFVMVPVTLLLLYNPTKYFIWIGLAVVSVAAILRLVMGILETRVSTKTPTFYIFLYFCALEIAPVATLVTAGLRYFSHGSVF
ncbi:MAG: DUF4271 domain-containing protein [Bacteroidales bacterium]|nr:DUF4271 domain-containing protein [Bacteroidales bacterium]